MHDQCTRTTLLHCRDVYRMRPSNQQTLEEMSRMQHPPVLSRLDLTHLGTLFVINARNLDGRFTLPELLEFAEFCDARRKMYPAHEFVVCVRVVLSCVYLLANSRLCIAAPFPAPCNDGRRRAGR